MFTLYGEIFPSRLLLGTAAYSTPEILKQSVQIAQPAMITVSVAPCRQRRRSARAGFFGRCWKKWAYLCCLIPQAVKAFRKP